MNVRILMGSSWLCEHSGLRYGGLYSVQDRDNLASFRTEEAVSGARAFFGGFWKTET